jgi:hypothetical protein
MKQAGEIESKNSAYAPVALFAYKRPEHLRRTIEALKQNPGFSESPIHIFFDGPRKAAELPAIKQTRDVARALLPAHAVFVEREQNFGLRRSIVEGVTELTRDYGRVIVVEDDLVMAKNFLQFMNAALDRYEHEPSVMQISGHMFPVSLASRTDSFFLPFTTTWGWGTWRRAWRKFDEQGTAEAGLCSDHTRRAAFDLNGAYPYFQMLQKQKKGEIDSWGILWYLSVFASGGLTLFPRQSLVINAGLDGTGTNCSYETPAEVQLAPLTDSFEMGWPPLIEVDSSALAEITGYLKRRQLPFRKFQRRFSFMWRSGS